jgi:hypothetical protein
VNLTKALVIPIKKAKFVIIDWKDACAYGGWSDSLNVSTSVNLAKCGTIGLEVYRDKEKIITCGSWQTDQARENIVAGGEEMVIPLSWLVKVRKVPNPYK